MLNRELTHRQIISEERGYETRMIGWIEVVEHKTAWAASDLTATGKADEPSYRGSNKPLISGN